MIHDVVMQFFNACHGVKYIYGYAVNPSTTIEDSIGEKFKEYTSSAQADVLR
jgi:hypothetical protein